MPTARKAGELPLACGRDPDHCGLRPEGAPAAGNGSMGHVAGRGCCGQCGAELVQMLAPLQVDEFGQCQAGPLDSLGGRAGDGEEKTSIGLGDLAIVAPVNDDDADRVIGDDQRDDGQATEAARTE